MNAVPDHKALPKGTNHAFCAFHRGDIVERCR